MLPNVDRRCDAAFKREGDMVVLLGAPGVSGNPASLAGSECLERIHGKVAGRPAINLDAEARLQRLVRRAIADGLLSSAHDCSDGGLAVALAESAIIGKLGFHADSGVFAAHPEPPGVIQRGSGSNSPLRAGEGLGERSGRWDAALFGEEQSRIVVSLRPDSLPALQQLASAEGVPLVRLGAVGADRFVIPGLVDAPLAGLSDAWSTGLERAVNA
jgi:phosphoribosylformylglycinamidine synthase